MAEVHHLKSLDEAGRFFLAKRLCPMVQGPNILQFLGFRTYKTDSGARGALFFEKPDASLQEFFDMCKSGADKISDRFKLTVSVDLLRGLTQMEKTRRRIVHRNIVPSSVFLFGKQWQGGGNVRAKLGGFGIGHFVGTLKKALPNNQWVDPLYTAPECFSGKYMSAAEWMRTDIWSAGVTLARLHAGSLPPAWGRVASGPRWRSDPGASALALREHISSRVKDEGVQRALLSMVELDPDKRASAEAALRSFEEVAELQHVHLPPAPRMRKPPLWEHVLGMPQELGWMLADPAPGPWGFSM